MGVAGGQALWTLAASAGVVALLSASEPAFRTLKLAVPAISPRPCEAVHGLEQLLALCTGLGRIP